MFSDLNPKEFEDCPLSKASKERFFVTNTIASHLAESNKTFPFDIIRLNFSRVILLKAYIVTTPEDGIYHFSLSGLGGESISDYYVRIYVRLNGKNVASVFAYASDMGTTFGLHLILGLKKGDQIDLHYNGGIYRHDYCQFTGTLLTPTSDIQQSLNVHFYVQRNSSFKMFGIIPFELAPLNEGNALDIDSGVFTAPVNGIYQFSLSGVKDGSNQSAWIKLRLNGEMIGSAYAAEHIPWAPFYLSSIIQMKLGDRVDLILQQGTCFDDMDHLTHFTGSRLSIEERYLNDNATIGPVHFYAQKNSSYSIEMSRIPFELILLNEGDAMNLTSGIFTVPRNGFYQFSSALIKGKQDDDIAIYLRKNGNIFKAFEAYGSPTFPPAPLSTYSLESVQNLQQGDEIDLYLQYGTIFDSNDHHLTHFTGSLIG